MNKVKKSIVKPLHLYALLFALVPMQRVLAQRGAYFDSNDRVPETPSSGFPGVFDTNTVRAGNFVLDLPTLAVDYGVSERFTLGTSGWIGGALLLGVPAIYAKARYRFLSAGPVVSAHTAYAGYLTSRFAKNANSQQISDTYFFAFSNNTRFALSDTANFNLTSSFIYFVNSAKQKSSLEYSKLSLSTVHLGLSYQNWWNNLAGPSILFLANVYQNTTVDTSTLSASASSGDVGIAGGFSMLRGMWELKLGRWLLSPSLIYLFELGQNSADNSESTATVLPWFSAAVEW